jgi:hypothetical protein
MANEALEGDAAKSAAPLSLVDKPTLRVGLSARMSGDG